VPTTPTSSWRSSPTHLKAAISNVACRPYVVKWKSGFCIQRCLSKARLMLFCFILTAELLKIYYNTPGILVITYHLLISLSFANVRVRVLVVFQIYRPTLCFQFTHLAFIYIGASSCFGNCGENKSLLCEHF
jgi:hypothetical protein